MILLTFEILYFSYDIHLWLKISAILYFFPINLSIMDKLVKPDAIFRNISLAITSRNIQHEIYWKWVMAPEDWILHVRWSQNWYFKTAPFHYCFSTCPCRLIQTVRMSLVEHNMSSLLVHSKVRVPKYLVFSLVFCRSLFVLSPFFFWSLYCQFLLYLRCLITHMVSSMFF